MDVHERDVHLRRNDVRWIVLSDMFDGFAEPNALGRVEWAVTIPLLWAGVWWNPDGMVVLTALVASVRGLAVIFGRAARPAFEGLPARERWRGRSRTLIGVPSRCRTP